MRPLHLLPPLVWTALIAWLSTAGWSAARTAPWFLPLLRALWPGAAPEQLEALHLLVRKAGHVGEYAVLALLWRRALGGWRAALGLSALTAGLDELHQALVPARGGAVADVLLDSLGAGAALLVAERGARATLEGLTGACLWVAAAGGTALLLVNWAAAAPSGWLWLFTPAGWIALVLWRRRRARA